jgi:hypothetical protein
MATKKNPAANLLAPLPATLVQPPANRRYVFAKNCTNDHGHFAKGDKARGAFSAALVDSYLQAGILVAAPTKTTETAPHAQR